MVKLGLYEKIIIPVVIVLILAGVYAVFFFWGEEGGLQLAPKDKTGIDVTGMVAGTEVGTGWSTKENPGEAVKEALGMALEGKVDKTPDFAIIFANAGSDLKSILAKSRELLGKDAKIYGGTSSNRAVMTDKGFVNVDVNKTGAMTGKRGLAVMTVSSDDIVFGVGSANYKNYTSAQDMAKAAITDAISSAGKTPGELPKIVLVTPTRLIEEECLEGIEEVVSDKAVVIGGTAGGPPRGVIGKDDVYEEGISLAVIYTNLSVGWTFEGGFDVKAPETGIVTKAENQTIIEIDGRPAIDVYDEWLEGEIVKLQREFGDERLIRDLLTLHPLYRKYIGPNGKEYNLFSHPWPKDMNLVDKSIMTSTKIKQGERIYISHGTWEILLNRIGNLPKNAKANGGFTDKKPIFGIGYVCNGVMGAIPEAEREKMPILLNYANDYAPFIAPFTSGEQGHFSGIGNKHGNLLTSFIVIG
jgi:hypothetical protein